MGFSDHETHEIHEKPKALSGLDTERHFHAKFAKDRKGEALTTDFTDNTDGGREMG